MGEFDIYTDGSHKEGVGSWAYLVVQNGEIVREVSGRERRTDCNRMEFQAVIEALKTISAGSTVTVHSDSRVLIENIPLFPEWSANGWVKKNKRPIPNVAQFVIINNLLAERQVSFKWVRAHSGNPYNDRCDQLCVLART